MPRKHQKPNLPEPPARKLRQTKSRIEYALRRASEAPSLVSSHFPSPEATASSSVRDKASPQKIARPTQTKTKTRPQTVVKPIHKRLSPAKKEEPRQKAPVINTKPKHALKAKHSPDIHDRFIQVAFEQQPQQQTQSPRKETQVPVPKEEEDPFDPAVLKRDIIQHFADQAGTLYQVGAKSLEQAHEDLLESLKRSANEDKKTFRKKVLAVSRPIDSLKLRYQVQTPTGAETRTSALGDLISHASKPHQEFLDKMDSLWKDWDKIGLELKEIVNGTQRVEVTDPPDDIMTEEQEEVERKALEKEIAKAEKEIELITEAALVCAKDIEKEHLKLTMPDLHRYYQSINIF
ncbi:hypothetical protein QBC38DRAFT_502276 [Podospora fimiseda]|uniref:Uncharacterized protein n=1 Tax=Podospora fimiseda TaxID=252190 RepID=A0AAN7GT05_9PEZI|nr:hypothetical protein QBC38DRAFT_502276 [Podospora fimiseda]